MEVESLVQPRTYKLRVVFEHPTADEVREALKALADAGAPPEAVIGFNVWNTPNDRYYVTATWTEELEHGE